MPQPVSAGYLLHGAAYALEQCGLLLRDANILYRNGSYASVIVLAGFAREELGRFTTLLDWWREALKGKRLTLKEIQNRCKDHEIKQKAGMLSSVMKGVGGRFNELLLLLSKADPQSVEWQNAHAEIEELRRRQDRRTPSDRHNKRVSALYVEPISQHQWNRPATTSHMIFCNMRSMITLDGISKAT
jgi:AbiV family abortive infection protein